jgi:hypothetical protein
MKLTEYLERAISLERMAADEPDSAFKTQLLEQAPPIETWPLSAQKIMGCRLPVLLKTASTSKHSWKKQSPL